VECQALYFKRAYAEATVACERAAGLGVGGYVTAMLLATLYMHVGEATKSRMAKDRTLKEFPGLRLQTFFQERQDSPLAPRYRDWAGELRQLGFPE
jgi:hypothetical protein